MAEPVSDERVAPVAQAVDVRAVVEAVVKEFLPKQEELAEERRRREDLERRVNELIAENEKARKQAAEAEQSAAIRAELQRAGVSKLDLAYRAIKEDIYRGEDGRLLARGGSDMREYVMQFVNENPELLPARLAGGSGASGAQRSGRVESGIDLDKIRPGMSQEDLDRVRREIARVASQTLRGI
jgi:hypothetical protein